MLHRDPNWCFNRGALRSLFYFFFTNQAAGVLGSGGGRAGKPGTHTKIEVRREGGKKAEGFFFLLLSLHPFPLRLKTSVSTQTHGATSRTESGGSWYATGPFPGMKGVAQLGAAALFICPDLAFAPVLLDLRE